MHNLFSRSSSVRLALLLALLILAALAGSPASAISNVTLTLTSTTPYLAYDYVFTASIDDWGSIDHVVIVCFDASGNIVQTDYSSVYVGQTEAWNYGCFTPSATVVCWYDVIVVDFGVTDYGASNGTFLAKAGTGACPREAGGAVGIFDGRLNSGDLAAPAAVYCNSGGYRVYDIDSMGQGTLALELTAEAVAAAMTEAAGGSNVLVASAGDIDFWVLAPGDKWQLSSPEINEPGKQYAFISGLIC